ncbi:hypothetical protein F4680DRAFT_435709, partial [Xylaria scruposa]
MSWELTRRRIVRTINSKYLFDRIVRHYPIAVPSLHPYSHLPNPQPHFNRHNQFLFRIASFRLCYWRAQSWICNADRFSDI